MSSSPFNFSVSSEDWNQDGAWYNSLPLLEKMGIKIERSTFKNVLRQVCKKLGITREQLHIVASPWATMYYKGVWSPVGYNDVDKLAQKGTDIIFTEKGDVAKVVGDPASTFGIAFVNTRGHLSDYADDLSDIAERAGGHVAIATDYDIPGILIASKLVEKGVLWLGTNEDMLRSFGMSKANKNIVVAYQPKKARMKEENFRNLVNDTPGFRGNVDIEFLKHKKIEINAVLATVGGKRLCEYFKILLGKKHPTRDYNRALESHPDLSKHYPMGIRIFNEYIKDHENSIVAEDVKEIETELKNVEGFINVPDKESEIDEQLGTIIEEDGLLKEVGLKLEELFKGRDPKKWNELAKKIEEADEKDRKKAEEEEKEQEDSNIEEPLVSVDTRGFDEEQEKEKGRENSAQRKFELRQKFGSILSKRNLEIQDVEGVGPTTARKFKEAGIVSVIDLAAADVDELAIDVNSSKETAEMFIKAANKLLEDTKQQAEDVT